jgi:hypothetical protein
MHHEMKVETEQYEKQYGYAYMSRVTCSCGYDSGMTAGDYATSIKAHRDQAILDALGLTFSVTR